MYTHTYIHIYIHTYMLVYMYIKSPVDLARTPLLLSSCDLLLPILSVDHKLLTTGESLSVDHKLLNTRESLLRDVRILAHKVVHDVHLRTQQKKKP